MLTIVLRRALPVLRNWIGTFLWIITLSFYSSHHRPREIDVFCLSSANVCASLSGDATKVGLIANDVVG
jgi:hypothetical protein